MLRTALTYFLLVLAFCSCTHRSGQAEDVRLFSLIEDSTLQLSPEAALQIYEQGKAEKVNDQYINIGFTKSNYWLVFSVPKMNMIDSTVLQIGDPHINQIHLYEINNRIPNLQFTTGDYYRFAERPFPHTDYYFPVNTNRTYMVKIDKHFESLQLYFGLHSIRQVERNEAGNFAFISLCTGMVLLLLIFGLYMQLISKEFVYLHYILYIGTMWIYVLAQLGYGFQFLWPDDPWFASKARPVLALLTIVLSMRFMEFYIGGIQHKKTRITLHVFGWLLIIIAITILLGSYRANTTGWWLYFQYTVPAFSIAYLLFALFLLIAQVIKGNKLALFYLVAVSSVIIISVFQLVYYTGSYHLHISFFSRFAFAISVVIEIIIITAGMAYRFNQYKRDKEELLLEMNRRQQENTKVLMEVQEAERDQIANQLHDVAGSLLSAARLNLSSLHQNGFSGSAQEKVKIQKAEEAVSIVSETVRNLSHALSPIMLQKAGFKTAVEKIASIFNASGKISIEVIIVGFNNPDYVQKYYTNIYGMIYELLNNVVKHAKAKHALVQVMEHEDCFTITVEDDGIGLMVKAGDDKDRNGISGIVSKVEYYKGQIAFDNSETGLITTIEIPIKT